MKIRLIVISILLFAAVYAAPSAASAAILYPLPNTSSVAPGETFVVPVLLDSEGQNINVVEATLTFPSGLFEVVDVLLSNSFLTLWPEEPSIDPAVGRVHLSGGVPNGSVVHNAEAFSVVLRAVALGTGIIDIDTDVSAVYLNDGFGSRASLTSRPVQVSNRPSDPFLPQLHSMSHPYEGVWYTSRSVQMNWNDLSDALYSFSFSKDPSVTPDEIPDEAEGHVSLNATEDGIWYFSLRQRIPGEEWGGIAQRRVQIDATAPPEFGISIIREDATGAILALFNPSDAASGIEHTDVRLLVPRFSWFPFFPQSEWVSAASPFVIDAKVDASQIEVRAIDKAGNVTYAQVPLPLLRQAQLQFIMVVATAVAVLGILILVIHAFMQNNAKRRR